MASTENQREEVSDIGNEHEDVRHEEVREIASHLREDGVGHVLHLLALLIVRILITTNTTTRSTQGASGVGRHVSVCVWKQGCMTRAGLAGL